MFVTNKRVAKKNRRQKVLLFLHFFQPGHKFSGRSDKLLAAGAKGLSKAGHQWLSELLAHLSPATAHSVFSLTRLTRFRPSVWLPWSWGAQSGVVASLLHRPPYPALSEAGHHWLSELLAHLNPGTAHSVSSLTRLTSLGPQFGCHGHGELSQEWWLVYYTAPLTPP